MSAVAERVARGAALLDGKLPGWAERIDLADLQLASCYRCILGQLFARSPLPAGTCSPYGLGTWALGIDRGSTYGFDGHDADQLNDEWRRVIASRRLALVKPFAQIADVVEGVPAEAGAR